jgi:RNA polymerase sigma-70 factor (ECF subfamily)
MTVQGFEAFVREAEPRLRRALVGHVPRSEVPDALADAFAYAWENWERVSAMDNPVGFLFRVAQSRRRGRRQGFAPPAGGDHVPDFETRLSSAIRGLSRRQRTAVWLVHGCGFTYAETAAALGISASAVGTHVARAMQSLRTALKV